jgi:hypothetical protein
VATFDDLEAEVKELRKTVSRLARGGDAADNEARVNEIVDAVVASGTQDVADVLNRKISLHRGESTEVIGAHPVSEVLE